MAVRECLSGHASRGAVNDCLQSECTSEPSGASRRRYTTTAYPVVVDDFRNHSDVASLGAGLEEYHCRKRVSDVRRPR